MCILVGEWGRQRERKNGSGQGNLLIEYKATTSPHTPHETCVSPCCSLWFEVLHYIHVYQSGSLPLALIVYHDIIIIHFVQVGLSLV